MTFPEFGPFSEFMVGEDCPYLSLLKLWSENVDSVIEQIDRISRLDGIPRWTTAMLRGPNWRPHLVAAIAYLLRQEELEDFAPLWAAIDAGSWVTPQLVVVAYFRDPKFAEEARRRIERHGSVSAPPGLDPANRHVATGPAEISGRSGKILASLLVFCRLIPSLASHQDRWRSDETNRALLDEDAAYDRSGEIAEEWMTSVSQRFEKRGVVLKAPGCSQ